MIFHLNVSDKLWNLKEIIVSFNITVTECKYNAMNLKSYFVLRNVN